MSEGKPKRVGVVIVDETADFMANPFMARFVSGLCGHLNDNNVVMILQGFHPEEFARLFPLRRAEADAYCVRLHGSIGERSRMLGVLERIDEPVVLVQETLSTSRPDTYTIRQDDHGGGEVLAGHLLKQALSRVAIVQPAYHGAMTAARTAGLRAGLIGGGEPIEIAEITARVNDFSSAYDAVCSYLRDHPRPDAVVGTNDELAHASLRALQDAGFSVPQDACVAGFNGFQPPSYTRPSLTTIVSAASSIGHEAGRAVLARLQSGAFGKKETILPVSFRKGGST